MEELPLNYSNTSFLYQQAVSLLKELITIESYSKHEEYTAACLEQFFKRHKIPSSRIGNNVIVKNTYYDEQKPTILLNSHHDTVQPNKAYTNDPFVAFEDAGKLYGLGSNDAGGCLVSLIAVFLYYYQQQDLQYNIILVASAEEEISGVNGIERVLPTLGSIALGIVGEPTKMQMAVAERGLLVMDCVFTGVAGHAARTEGMNALYGALDDILWIRNHRFEKVSDLLGETTMTVTMIDCPNTQHNVVPPLCTFTVDIRVNEQYTFDEIMASIRENIQSSATPRSTRIKSTSVSLEHPIVKAGISMGLEYYGSPTTSDKALMNFPALKIGPGDSARSHSANEFIFLEEISHGIELYIQLLHPILLG